jgi:RNA polymerase sigma factor (TIGR02999 family)
MSISDSAQAPSSPKTSDTLFAEVYARLKAMAGRQRSHSDATLNTTGLVHELYLKLSSNREMLFDSPAQFFDYAAQAMRHILVDRARERLATKRGGELIQESEEAAAEVADKTAAKTLQLDMALRKLEAADARASRLVTLHYFGGLSFPEIATLTGLATRTLNRDWRHARAFLQDEIE